MFFSSFKNTRSENVQVDYNLFTGSIAVPSNFMGLHFHRWPYAREGANRITPAPDVSFGLVRSHDSSFSYTGSIFWRGVHTAASTYDFTSYMDGWVDAHYNSGRDLIYCLYGTPTWAAKTGMEATADAYGYLGGAAPPNSMADLGNFVTQLVTRYNGGATKKIKFLEVWNEPTLPGSLGTGFFWGTASEMAQMAKTVYQAAKAVDSTITILSPGFTGNLSSITNFLSASDGASGTGKDWIEGIGYHFYNSYPLINSSLNIQTSITSVRNTMTASGLASDFPIYNTEQGYLTPNGDSYLNATDLVKSIMVTRGLIVQAFNGIKCACLYTYDDDAGGAMPMGTIPMYNSTNLKNIIRFIHNKIAGKTITKVDVMKNGKFKVSCTGQPDFLI